MEMPISLNEQKSSNRPEELKKYDRLKHTDDEVRSLRVRGFVPVVSSNVSAVGRDGEKLLVRFHGGATYVYPNSGDLYQPMLSANSKGRFVWDRLRKANVRYYRTRNYNLPDDVESRDIMTPMADTDVTVDTLATTEAKAQVVTVRQAQAQEVIIDIERVRRQVARVRPRTIDTSMLALSGIDEAIALGIILSLAVSEEENSRQA